MNLVEKKLFKTIACSICLILVVFTAMDQIVFSVLLGWDSKVFEFISLSLPSKYFSLTPKLGPLDSRAAPQVRKYQR